MSPALKLDLDNNTKPYHLALSFGTCSISATIWNTTLDIVGEDEIDYEVEDNDSTLTSIKTILSALTRVLDKLDSSSLSLVGSIGGTVATYHLYHLPSGSLLSPNQLIDDIAPLYSATPQLVSLIQHRLPSYHPCKYAHLPSSWPTATLAQHIPKSNNGRFVTLGCIVTSLLTGQQGCVIPQEIELVSGNLYRQEQWDEDLFDAAFSDSASMMGEALNMDLIGECKVVGEISEYWNQWGLERCTIMPFIPGILAERLSTLSQDTDITMSFSSSTDYMVLPIMSDEISRAIELGGTIVTRLMGNSAPPDGNLLAVFPYQGGKIRRTMRNKYGNGKWSQFSQLARIMPPGGVLTFDNKLYIIPSPDDQNLSSWSQDGVVKFEEGEPVFEFREIRANPRCVLESQFLHLRGIQLALSSVSDGQRDGKRIVISNNMAECFAAPFILAQIFKTSILTPRIPHTAACATSLLAFFALPQAQIESISWSTFVRDLLDNVYGDETPTPSPPITPLSDNKDGDDQRSPFSRVGSELSLIDIVNKDRPLTPPSTSPQMKFTPPRIVEIPPSPPDTPKPRRQVLQSMNLDLGSSSWMRLLAWPGRDEFPHLVYRAMLIERQRLSGMVRGRFLPRCPAITMMIQEEEGDVNETTVDRVSSG